METPKTNSKPKAGEQQKPPWQEFARPDGSKAYDFGSGQIDRRTIDQLCEQVKRDHKGKPLDVKSAELKKLIEAYCKDGDASMTAVEGGGRLAEDYLATFRQSAKTLPKDFAEFVPQSTKAEGDHILAVATKVNYPITAYQVAKSDYADALREGANKIVYHAYVGHGDHGEELLRRLMKLGITAPYELIPVATTVAAKENWQKDPNVKIEEIDGKRFTRSMMYAIAFSPEEKQVKQLVNFFKRNIDHKKKDAIPNSWKTPDVRASTEEPPDEFDETTLNRKSANGYDLLILNKEPIEGFKASKLWINKQLSKFAKAVSILWVAPVRLPLIISFKKSVCLRKLVYENGFLVAKAFPYHKGRPGQVGGSTPDPQTEKQRDVQRVMREEQSRGRTPLMSEEAREQNTKRLREMRQLLQMNDWGAIARVLTAYGVSQDSDEWKMAQEAFRQHQRRGLSS